MTNGFDSIYIGVMISQLAATLANIIFSETNLLASLTADQTKFLNDTITDSSDAILNEVLDLDSLILAAIDAQTDILGNVTNSNTTNLLDALAGGISALDFAVDDSEFALTTLIGSVFNSLQNQIEGFDLDITDELQGQSEFLNLFQAGQTRHLASLIDASTDTLIDNADSNTDSILGQLTSSITDSDNLIQSILDDLFSPVDAGIAGISNAINSLTNTFTDSIDTSNGFFETILSGLGGTVEVAIDNKVVVDDSIFGTIVDVVTGAIDRSNAALGGVIAVLSGDFKRGIDQVIGAMIDLIPGEQQELKDIADAILHNKDKNLKIAETATDDSDKGLGAVVIESILRKVEPGLELSSTELMDAARLHLTAGLDAECEKITLESLINTKGLTHDLSRGIVEWLISVSASILQFATLSQAKAQSSLPVFLYCNPNLPMSPQDAILALQRGLIDDDTALRRIRESGFYSEQAELMIRTGFHIPDLTLLFNMWYRDLIDDTGLDYSLKALGFEDGYIKPLKEMVWFIPPVQDLVMMAVREVFNEPLAREQGQFEDFPEDFADNARKQGVSKEWAQRYWAAHWTLPSVQMGFEMLHRGEIDIDKLRTLMKALDIMPGWRDPLIAISYSPFTRVDIRRMNALGVLDESEVNKAYHEIGYNDDKAAKLTAFTLELNQEEDPLTLDVASDLSRSAILGFYTDGIIGKVEASALLLQAGVNVAAAALFILGADFDIERRERRQDIEIVFDRYKFGIIDFTEASGQVTALNLQPRELDLALLDLERLRDQQTKTPSKADLDKFLKGGLIDSDQYITNLNRMGYNSFWSNKYLALASGGAASG